MRTYPEQLAQRLEKGLTQNILVFGNEPLLKEEATSICLKAGKAQGFLETHRFVIDANLKWQDIHDTCQAMSLFANRQIIILQFPEKPLTTAQANELKSLASVIHDDILLVLVGPRLTKQQESTKWFTTFSKLGIYVPCNSPEFHQLPKFIENRSRQLHLQLDKESIETLAHYHEGNLLALSQTLLKLQLLFTDGKITHSALSDALSRHNHFTPFQLIDAALAGQASRTQLILRQLEAEGVEITLLARLLQKEIFQLRQMKVQLNSGTPTYTVFDQLKIWQNRRQALSNTLNRLSLLNVNQLINTLAEIEVLIKTDGNHQAWTLLSELCLSLSGYSINLPKFE